MFNVIRKSFKSIAVLSAISLIVHEKQEYIRSLGIMGYIGKEPKAIDILLDGLEKIPNNDYTASGLATIHGTEVRITKYANTSELDSLQRLRKETPLIHEGSTIGIGHTHISKSGQKTDTKAHPQCDHNNRIFVVHNGSITNSNELLSFIQSRGIQPKTESNTEIVAIMIGIFVDDGHPLKVATRLALEKVSGTWGLVVMDKLSPDQLIVAQQGSPLFLGLGEEEFILSSDISTLSTPKIMKLEDGCVYTLSPSTKKIEMIKIKSEQSMLSLGDYAH